VIVYFACRWTRILLFTPSNPEAVTIPELCVVVSAPERFLYREDSPAGQGLEICEHLKRTTTKINATYDLRVPLKIISSVSKIISSVSQHVKSSLQNLY
jgi:hypothetical protein